MVLPKGVSPEPGRVASELVGIEIPAFAYSEVPFEVKPGQAIMPDVVAKENCQ